jgi:hypothetical protein
MKTDTITRAFRASATPAARLAAWQNKTLAFRRKSLADYYVKTATLEERRNARIAATGPVISAPDADEPILWLSSKHSPMIADFMAGRDALKHSGWYCDEFQDDTLETYAVRLRAFPRLIFYAVMSCGGLRVELSEWEEIDFSKCESERDADDARDDCARDLIRDYDSATESTAEDEMEFHRVDRVEFDITENRERLKILRSEIRELCRELKTLCPSALAMNYPAAGKAVFSALSSLLGERRELMTENENLAARI